MVNSERILKLPCRPFPLLWRILEASCRAPDFQDFAATVPSAAASKAVSVILWQKEFLVASTKSSDCSG